MACIGEICDLWNFRNQKNIRPLSKAAFEPKLAHFMAGQGLFLRSYWIGPDEKTAEIQPERLGLGQKDTFKSGLLVAPKFEDGQGSAQH
ncbi:MAG: hypothetical protein SFV22_12420 [Saprospiraceae bacterium]|nr:hypothetical protein [Saprospiraceae bacterium]